MKGWERCETCKFLDQKRSNKNWIVCPKMPKKVILEGTSKFCKNYVALKELEGNDD